MPRECDVLSIGADILMLMLTLMLAYNGFRIRFEAVKCMLFLCKHMMRMRMRRRRVTTGAKLLLLVFVVLMLLLVFVVLMLMLVFVMMMMMMMMIGL